MREHETKSINTLLHGNHTQVEVAVKQLTSLYQEDRIIEDKGSNYGSIDLYALSIPLIGEIVTQTLNNRKKYPPFGLQYKSFQEPQNSKNTVENFPLHAPFTFLRKAMNHTLQIETDEYFSNRTAEQLDNPTSIPNKNFALYSLLAQRHQRNQSFGSSSTFIKSGMRTGADMMSSTLEVIPHVITREYGSALLDPVYVTRVAKNSFPILTTLAMSHLSPFISLTDHIGGREGNSFKPNYFSLSSSHQLTLTPEAKDELMRKYGQWLDQVPLDARKIIGCPAHYSGALKQLWDWHLDLAQGIYQKQFGGNSIRDHM